MISKNDVVRALNQRVVDEVVKEVDKALISSMEGVIKDLPSYDLAELAKRNCVEFVLDMGSNTRLMKLWSGLGDDSNRYEMRDKVKDVYRGLGFEVFEEVSGSDVTKILTFRLFLDYESCRFSQGDSVTLFTPEDLKQFSDLIDIAKRQEGLADVLGQIFVTALKDGRVSYAQYVASNKLRVELNKSDYTGDGKNLTPTEEYERDVEHFKALLQVRKEIAERDGEQLSHEELCKRVSAEIDIKRIVDGKEAEYNLSAKLAKPEGIPTFLVDAYQEGIFKRFEPLDVKVENGSASRNDYQVLFFTLGDSFNLSKK